jgi:hypothetical protein
MALAAGDHLAPEESPGPVALGPEEPSGPDPGAGAP